MEHIVLWQYDMGENLTGCIAAQVYSRDSIFFQRFFDKEIDMKSKFLFSDRIQSLSK